LIILYDDGIFIWLMKVGNMDLKEERGSKFLF